jgi:hypothetical protein
MTYVFEVAADSAFSSKSYTSSKIAAGSSQTSVTIDKTLVGGTYYWRAQSYSGDVAGPYGTPLNFTVKPQVVIGVPTVVSPINGDSVGLRPHFVIKNATTSNAVGTIVYNYQISRNSTFTDKVESGTAIQQSGTQTEWDGKADLANGTTFYWRAWAVDGDSNTGDYSAAGSFKTLSFDATKAIFVNNPPLNTWAETRKITLIDFSSGNVVVDFEGRLSNPWPDVPMGRGTIEYTLGMCFNLSNQWYCSAAIEFWYGRDLEAGGDMWMIADDYYYDARWREMTGHQPKYGEIVGIFVGAGDLRDSKNWKVEERSNVVLIPYGTNYQLR